MTAAVLGGMLMGVVLLSVCVDPSGENKKFTQAFDYCQHVSEGAATPPSLSQ